MRISFLIFVAEIFDKEDWKKLKRKFEAYLKSFNIARISMNDNCIYDLIPHGFIKEFFDARNRITKHVFDTYEKPKNYDFLKDTHKSIGCHIVSTYNPL